MLAELHENVTLRLESAPAAHCKADVLVYRSLADLWIVIDSLAYIEGLTWYELGSTTPNLNLHRAVLLKR
jgi:hypothetical protein